MDSYSDETEVTPVQLAVVALGVVAFSTGHGHGMNLRAGGTPAGKAILDEKNHDIWIAIYDIALKSVVMDDLFAVEEIDKRVANVVDAISSELPELLTDKGRREQIRENFHSRIPDKIVHSVATEIAALNLGAWASLTGRKLGIAKSTWVPPASIWVDIFEAAREGAMLGARIGAQRIESHRFQDGEIEEIEVDDLIKTMKTVSAQKATEVTAPLSITSSAIAGAEEERETRAHRQRGLSRLWNFLKG
ncbi:MAG: hypothetical protein OXC55_07785 [Chloroflexi bacterium]|nr:hypothetical protein [Chloroflexota bacterium]